MKIKQNDPERVREEGVNVLLAQALRNRGLSARAERRSRQGVPDVRIDLGSGDLVILECKWAGSAGLLESQLDGRLIGFPEAIGVIGVLYPDRLRRAENISAELEAVDDLRWWLHGSRGAAMPEPLVRSGSVAELADELRTLPLQLEGVDRVAAAAGAVGYALEQAAVQIAKHARISRRIADIIANTDQEKDRAAALRIGCLVLFNALAFQDRLASVNEDVPTVDEALGRQVTGLQEAWRYICDKIDYVPVFELAANILGVLSDGPADIQMPVLHPLVRAVRDTRRLEGHDLSGRLFHTLLTDAKFTGAYYTSVPAATLLSRLVFHDWPPHVDWGDHEFPASLNVADLACGTGTLLMAVATEVARRHEAAGGRHSAELHKAMVEQALHGYDVQLSAVHFAATSLAMLNPNIQFDRMNLYVMPLGAEGDTVSLGSLDFLGVDQAPVQYAISVEGMGVETRDAERVSGTGPRGVEEGETATLPDLDLAIMNPPFTRSVIGNLLFGSVPPKERPTLQTELKRRLKSRLASATAGLGAAFVATVSPRLRQGEGRLALVLPATVCTGPSWEQTRSLIERDYALDMVITSHDPMRWNFSDSTDLSEALLIATRRPRRPVASERRTTFVNLWRNPDSVLGAHRVARAVTTATPSKYEETGTALLEVDGQHIGEVVSMPESKLAGKQWVGVQFARADLVRSALKLLDDGEMWIPGEGSIGSVPLCRLDGIGSVGPDVRRLSDGFDKTSAVTGYPLVEGHDTEKRRSLTCSPDRYLAPLARPRGGQRPGYGERLSRQSSRLLVGARFWLNTTRVAAMWCGTAALGSMWWPVKAADASAEKSLVMWLNSSLGLLTWLAIRNTTRGSWVQLKKANLETLPVLDVRRLSSAQLQGLSDLFDEMAEEEFERLPAMAYCPARRLLDEGISKILDLPDLGKLRELLASEPVVSGRRL